MHLKRIEKQTQKNHFGWADLIQALGEKVFLALIETHFSKYLVLDIFI